MGGHTSVCIIKTISVRPACLPASGPTSIFQLFGKVWKVKKALTESQPLCPSFYHRTACSLSLTPSPSPLPHSHHHQHQHHHHKPLRTDTFLLHCAIPPFSSLPPRFTSASSLVCSSPFAPFRSVNSSAVSVEKTGLLTPHWDYLESTYYSTSPRTQHKLWPLRESPRS